jgi:hypothetical protein
MSVSSCHKLSRLKIYVFATSVAAANSADYFEDRKKGGDSDEKSEICLAESARECSSSSMLKLSAGALGNHDSAFCF